MNTNIELLEYIYKSSSMGVTSSKELIKQINGKENKIKEVLEDILKEYEKIYKESKKLILKNKSDLKENSMIAKISASMSMKMDVMKDNSDSNIAHILVQGLTMGILDISTKIKRYKNEVDKKILKLAKNYLKFQEEYIEILKEYY